MIYVHETFNTFVHRMQPRAFRRSLSRPLRPIPGGRWMIRKLKVASDGRPWRAWSNGKARPYARCFETHAEAVAWAQAIALTYKVGDPDTRSAMRQELHDKRRAEGLRASQS